MSFEVILKDLVESVPKATGAIVVDWEGEGVMEHCLSDDPYNIRFIGAHKGLILARLKEMKINEQLGTVEEMIITATEMHLITGCINKDYFLVMNLQRSAPLALALYHFRRAISELKKEF